MQYRKSSFSTHATSSCVEAAHQSWQTASFSFSNGNCVQAAGAEFAKAQASSMNGGCVEAGAAGFSRAAASNQENCVEAGAAGFTRAEASQPQAHCVEAGTADFTRAAASTFNGNCVEAGAAEFIKTEASLSNTACAEAGDHADVVFLRDSKDPKCATGDFPHLHFPRATWDGGRAVRFDLIPVMAVPEGIRKVAVSRGHDSDSTWYAVSSGQPQDSGTILYFDQAEKDAWEQGVENGEFALAVPVAA